MTARNTYVRGVNDILARPWRGAGRALSQPERASALARLEQQKALLQKQLRVWIKQHALTEARLRAVNKQIAEVAAGAGKADPVSAARPAGVKSRSVAAVAGKLKRRPAVAHTF